MHVDGLTVSMMLNMQSRQVPRRPPELIDDESAPPVPSADIWSLAAVLLQCLTGRPPYEGMRSMQMRRALLQRHAPGPVPEDLPTSLKRLLRQCFHDTPDQRPSLLQIQQVCKQRGPVSCNYVYAEDASGRYMAGLNSIWDLKSSAHGPHVAWHSHVNLLAPSAVAAFSRLDSLVPMKTCCSAMMPSCIGPCICPCIGPCICPCILVYPSLACPIYHKSNPTSIVHV